MANILDLLMGTKGGWNPDVQQTGVRPGYGLGTATGVDRPVRSQYQRTLDPGETRTPSQLQEMLAEVILAAGSAAVPGAGPRGQARQMPGGRRSPAKNPTLDRLAYAVKHAEKARTALDTTPKFVLGKPYPQERIRAQAVYDNAIEVLQKMMARRDQPEGGWAGPNQSDWE